VTARATFHLSLLTFHHPLHTFHHRLMPKMRTRCMAGSLGTRHRMRASAFRARGWE